jgi:hypothetical protein
MVVGRMSLCWARISEFDCDSVVDTHDPIRAQHNCAMWDYSSGGSFAE